MKDSPNMLALSQSLEQCQRHADALNEALDDIRLHVFTPDTMETLSKLDRRLLDQFAYRYTRLQDDMGARLMPAVLRALGEEVAAMPAIDRFARLEQLDYLASADEWNAMRQIRNQFAHDYPDSTQERFERLMAAIGAAKQVVATLEHIAAKLEHRFGK
ncbi:hypothetical protein [Rhodoferax sp.]|uniref:hypothetical protein n=1 Tax=Rhodoferax sp. TaxID=50421 RepID=UPI00260656A5|nr:hypothetical protein [Rhodoferax sp.]MDD5478777.1 hypothetical protein [Rhodoferax sp.]